MKRTIFIPGIVCVILAQAFLSQTAFGQAAGNPVFELKKFNVLQPKSPVYTGKSYNYTENTENWAQIVCEYKVAAPEGWMDNVTFKWSVHLLGAETERLVLPKNITYDKVEADGKKLQRSVVYVSPRDIRRYISANNSSVSQSKVVVYIEIMADGIKVGEFQYPKGTVRGLPPQWWNSRQVNRKEGVLLSRTESPWADMDHDTWVPERPSENPPAQ